MARVEHQTYSPTSPLIPNSMARALVIGGTAFIGRNLVEQLLERGDEVVIMHRGSANPYGDRVGEIRCDRNDIPAVHTALDGKRFDLVFDNVYDFQRGTSAEQVVAAATALASGVKRYVFTSSVAVYPMGGATHEEATLVGSDDLVLTSAPMIVVNGVAYVGALDDPSEFSTFVLGISNEAYQAETATPTPTPTTTP